MDLQGDEPFTLANFFVLEVDHLLAIQPGGNFIADDLDFHLVPFAGFEGFFGFGSGLDEPSPAIRFVHAAAVAIQWGHFDLPTADLHTLDAGAEKDPTVAVGFLLELQGEYEVFVFAGRGKVAICFVGPAFADQFTFFNVPFFSAMDVPATEVFLPFPPSPLITIETKGHFWLG